MVIQSAEVINFLVFYFVVVVVDHNWEFTHPSSAGAEMLTNTVLVWCGTDCHEQEKDTAERLLQ